MFDEAWQAAAALYAELGQIKAVLWAYPLVPSLWFAVKIFSFVFVVVFFLEWLTGGNLRRYWTRNFRTDMTYGIFYTGGIYNLLVYAPLVAGLTLHSPDLGLPAPQSRAGAGRLRHLLDGRRLLRLLDPPLVSSQPDPVGVPQGPPRPDRADVRHILAQSRGRADRLQCPDVRAAVGAGPAALVLGAAHSDCNTCSRECSTPISNGATESSIRSSSVRSSIAIHHSPDRARHDSNYGKILSVWDYLFGTMSVGERPARYGVAGVDMPVSF